MNEELILKNQRMIMESLRLNTDNEWLQTHLDKQIQETSEHISKLRQGVVISTVCECEPRTRYEWEKDENECSDCGLHLFKAN
jgi:hypothetical protein